MPRIQGVCNRLSVRTVCIGDCHRFSGGERDAFSVELAGFEACGASKVPPLPPSLEGPTIAESATAHRLRTKPSPPGTKNRRQIFAISDLPNHRPTNFPIDLDFDDNPQVTVKMGT